MAIDLGKLTFKELPDMQLVGLFTPQYSRWTERECLDYLERMWNHIHPQHVRIYAEAYAVRERIISLRPKYNQKPIIKGYIVNGQFMTKEKFDCLPNKEGLTVERVVDTPAPPPAPKPVTTPATSTASTSPMAPPYGIIA